VFNPAPLPPQPFAGLLADIRAEADRHATSRALGAGVVASLHALILAAFARLLTALEQLFGEWRAGTLPIPTPRTIAPRPAPAPDAAAPPQATNPSRRARSPRAPAALRPPVPEPAPPLHQGVVAAPQIRACARPHFAATPAPKPAPITPHFAFLTPPSPKSLHTHNVTISKQ